MKHGVSQRIEGGRHLGHITDLSSTEIRYLVDLARLEPSLLGRPLQDRGVALIFEKPSNRTRQSMEVAVAQLGGHPVYTRGEEIGFDVREPVEDVARIMSGYHAIIAARVFSHQIIDRLADASSVPVINMLSDVSHPLQALADAKTMIEEFGAIDGMTVAYVGDYNNVARSLTEICLVLGANVRIATPKGFGASSAEIRRLAGLGTGTVSQTDSPEDAVRGAMAVHTDTWVSMGQESEKEERLAVFGRYSVTAKLFELAAEGSIFMHCLPAYRGLEVEAAVIDGPASRVIEQGHNRLHTARASLAFLVHGVQPLPERSES
ncbi:MAG: ornithine carbamoyltransferase [Ilumatobacteraceae bacterium]